MQPYTEYLTGFLAARVAEDKAGAEGPPGWNWIDRALAEAALKQLILGRHPPKPLRYVDADRCPRCAAMWPCPEVEALALVYSAHQDWRPPP